MALVGDDLLGRVIDGLGNPLDGKGSIKGKLLYPIYTDPISPLERSPIREPLDTGIRSINALLTCGKGQRIGIFSGSGVGKSILLGMIARNTSADVSVIALVGERGREVAEFIHDVLGKKGLDRSIVIAATSDQPPLIRLKAGYLAMTIAEYFRDSGKDVILMMDSITRFAMAQREVGLSLGEPPTTKGYTPSVFATLPRLLERAGSVKGGGSITGFFTVLVESDDMNDTIADAVRSILDGHIILSRDIANQGIYPAIDCLMSVSRVMINVVSSEHLEASKELLDLLSQYRRAEDLILLGAYVQGSNHKVDRALALMDRIQSFLRQGIDERADLNTSIDALFELIGKKGKK
jgi:flagellum-specific ATP synthase